MSGQSGARYIGVAGAALLLAVTLSACTTIEGTNAVGDIKTFEREVGRETLKGLGMIPRETKAPIETPRGLLALPKDGVEVPPPSAETSLAELPVDSDKAKIDTTGLSAEQLKKIRKIVVFDGIADSGRRLTDAEIAQLVRHVESGRLRLALNADTPLWVPDQKYFTISVGGQDAVCLAANGDLVPLDDPACPPDIRAKIAQQQS